MLSAPTAGRFVWHELRTGDRRRALDFYCMLMGWPTRQVILGNGTPYGLCDLDGKDHAGVIRSAISPREAAYWLPYLAADDVDATTARAECLGGRVLAAPADIPNIGRVAIVSDPQGATFAIYRHATRQPKEPETPPVGSFCREDLLTTHPEEAAGFYASLFGYTVESVDPGPLGAYRILRRGQRRTAGIMPLSRDAQAGAHWLTYLRVKDVGRAVRNAKEIGATVRVPPRDIPGIGRFGVLADPTGAAFGVFRAP
jgi:predicted enzyme related to lactoylglutathione lyase